MRLLSPYFLRVLRPGRVVYLAIPDKRFTFDRDCETTSMDHVLRDYREGPEWSFRGYFAEWIRVVHGIKDAKVAEHEIARHMEMGYSIHCHCWTQTGMLDLLATLQQDLGFGFDMELFVKHGDECVCILKKSQV